MEHAKQQIKAKGTRQSIIFTLHANTLNTSEWCFISRVRCLPYFCSGSLCNFVSGHSLWLTLWHHSHNVDIWLWICLLEITCILYCLLHFIQYHPGSAQDSLTFSFYIFTVPLVIVFAHASLFFLSFLHLPSVNFSIGYCDACQPPAS